MHGLPNGYPPNIPSVGGEARAQILAQQYAQQKGLALPGQRPQGMPPQSAQAQQMYAAQQRQAQAALQQQQAQPRIKVENDSPQIPQGQFQQMPRPTNPAYTSQTDGADEGMEEWKAYMAARRAVTAEQTQQADRLMRDYIAQSSAELESGLMVPLDEQPRVARGKKRQRIVSSNAAPPTSSIAGPSSVPQVDGVGDADEKAVKDEEDEDAINSDLDSDNDPVGDLDEVSVLGLLLCFRRFANEYVAGG
jgi:transcription initiation factor TFIIA large subunit